MTDKKEPCPVRGHEHDMIQVPDTKEDLWDCPDGTHRFLRVLKVKARSD